MAPWSWVVVARLLATVWLQALEWVMALAAVGGVAVVRPLVGALVGELCPGRTLVLAEVRVWGWGLEPGAVWGLAQAPAWRTGRHLWVLFPVQVLAAVGPGLGPVAVWTSACPSLCSPTPWTPQALLSSKAAWSSPPRRTAPRP